MNKNISTCECGGALQAVEFDGNRLLLVTYTCNSCTESTYKEFKPIGLSMERCSCGGTLQAQEYEEVDGKLEGNFECTKCNESWYIGFAEVV